MSANCRSLSASQLTPGTFLSSLFIATMFYRQFSISILRRRCVYSETATWSIIPLCLSEIEAKEACTWLRAAGFPQYAQLYEGKNAIFLLDGKIFPSLWIAAFDRTSAGCVCRSQTGPELLITEWTSLCVPAHVSSRGEETKSYKHTKKKLQKIRSRDWEWGSYDLILNLDQKWHLKNDVVVFFVCFPCFCVIRKCN